MVLYPEHVGTMCAHCLRWPATQTRQLLAVVEAADGRVNGRAEPHPFCDRCAEELPVIHR